MIVNITIIIITLLTFGYAAYCDIKTRIIPFETWYPLILVSSVFTIMSLTPDFLIFAITICSFYTIAYFKFIGGADAWAVICLILFFIMPLKIPFIEFCIILIGALAFGAIICILSMIQKRSWDAKIPFIPSIVVSLIIYAFFFGVPRLYPCTV